MVLHQAPPAASDVEPHRQVQALLQSYASPGTDIDYCYPDDHPGAGLFAAMARVTEESPVQTELPYVLSAPALLRKIVWASETGYDAVVLRNAFDPAVEAARLAVRIPVIGPARITLHVAAGLAERIGVTVPFDGYIPWTRRLVADYHMDGQITAIRSLGLPGIHGVDRSTLREAARAHALDVMQRLIDETGAECIVPLGSAIVPSLVAPPDLEAALGVPVLNPNAIAIQYAEMCVRLGMTHSRRSYPSVQLALASFSARALE